MHPRYWINTVSRDHVQRGMEGAPKRARVIRGFTQANHGRPTGLRKLQRGDLMVFYSPRTAYPTALPSRPSPPSAASSMTSPTRSK